MKIQHCPTLVEIQVRVFWKATFSLPENEVTKVALPHRSGQVSGLSKIVAFGMGTRHDHLPFLQSILRPVQIGKTSYSQSMCGKRGRVDSERLARSLKGLVRPPLVTQHFACLGADCAVLR